MIGGRPPAERSEYRRIWDLISRLSLRGGARQDRSGCARCGGELVVIECAGSGHSWAWRAKTKRFGRGWRRDVGNMSFRLASASEGLIQALRAGDNGGDGAIWPLLDSTFAARTFESCHRNTELVGSILQWHLEELSQRFDIEDDRTFGK